MNMPNWDLHDKCLRACAELRARHPDHAAAFDRRERRETGTAFDEWCLDYLALNDVAGSIAGDMAPLRGRRRRANDALAQLGIG